jgi:GPI ethanolamine phosphate transferase 3 subunit O
MIGCLIVLYVGHVLGLDHAGHTYEVNKHRYQEKLDLYSDLLSYTYDNMANDTILIVLGDHGVRPMGGHGGGGIEEITSYLFATYKGDQRFSGELTKELKKAS